MNDRTNTSTPVGDARATVWSCVVVFALALVLRLVSLVQLRDTPVARFLIGDGEGYDAWARRIAGGQWVGSESFYQAPLYPYALGAIYRVLGPEPGAARLMQALGGSLACVILLLAGRRFFGSLRAGVAAGVLLAAYPPAIFFDGLIQKSSLDVLLTCLVLALASHLAASMGRRARMGWSVALGLALALLTLTRENALALLPVLAAWAWWTSRASPRAERFLAAGALVVGLAAGLTPAVIHNAAAGGEFHLTTAQMGPNLYIGNNPNAVGSYMPLRPGRGTVGAERADATALAQEALGRPLTPAQVNAYWTHQAWRFIVEQPRQWVRLMGRKMLLLVHRVEIADTDDQYTCAAWSWPLRLGYGLHFGAILALAAAGCVVAGRAVGRSWVIAATVLVYGASVVAFYVVARYRLPLAPPLMLLAGAGIAAVIDEAPSVPRGRWAAAGVAGLAALAISFNPVASIREERGNGEFSVGYLLLTRGSDPAAAVPHLQRSIAVLPNYVEAHKYLGDALALARGPEAGLAHYQQAVALAPGYGAAWAGLGRAQYETRRAADAAVSLRRAASLVPGDSDVRLMWAGALMQLRQEAEAADVMKAAARDFPNEPQLHVAAAFLLATSPIDAARDGMLAVALAERGCALFGSATGRPGGDASSLDPTHLSVLAAAYAEAGRFAEALTTLERAAATAQTLPEPNRSDLLRTLADHAALYRAGRPLRRK